MKVRELAIGFGMGLTLASGMAVADAETATQRIEQRERDLAELMAPSPMGGNPNSCGSAPLPTTPVGPTGEAIWRRLSTGGDQVRATSWRIPCSATDSMVVVTLTPIPGAADTFVCASSLTLLQSGGLQTNSFDFRNDPSNIGSFCGDVLQAVTVAVQPRSNTPASFDFDQAMTISYDGFNTGAQPLQVPLFDPAAYSLIPPPGPNSVEVFVRGSSRHFRNCQVSQTQQGGAIQYTASCNDETPLKFSGFQRFDH